MSSTPQVVVLDDGTEVGWTYYHNTSDIQICTLWQDPSHIRDDLKRLGKFHCEFPPETGWRVDPHRMKWATLFAGYDEERKHGERVLYCDMCKCLVMPPHDGYVYLKYPKSWLPESNGLTDRGVR